MSMLFAGELLSILMSILVAIPSLLMGLAGYLLRAAAIYVIASRRELNKPWLAWIPVVNVWMLGSLSDQYQYVVNRRNTSRRKVLLILNLIKPALSVAVLCFGIAAVIPMSYGSVSWESAVGALGFALPATALSIAVAVVRFIALYDVYKSLDPNMAVMFLVLSIIFPVTEPFFLFFNRNKESGMPPRKQAAQECE